MQQRHHTLLATQLDRMPINRSKIEMPIMPPRMHSNRAPISRQEDKVGKPGLTIIKPRRYRRLILHPLQLPTSLQIPQLFQPLRRAVAIEL
jgi:hypothetical protein